MDKRILAIGIILMFVSLLWGAASAPALPKFNNTLTSTAAIAPNSYAYGTIGINQSSLLVFSYISSLPVNFYLFNSYGASYLNSSKANLLSYDVSNNMTPYGLLTATLNSTRGSTPYVSNYSTYGVSPPSFSSGNSSVLLNGTYYFIFTSQQATPANVTYSYTTLPLSVLSGSGLQDSIEDGIVPALLFLAGVFVLVFGLLKSKQKPQGPSEDEIKKLYAKIDGQAKSKKRKLTKHRKKKS